MEMLASLNQPEGPFSICKAELDALKKKLEPVTGWKALGKAIVWPLKKGDVNKILGILERSKTNFSLALGADQA